MAAVWPCACRWAGSCLTRTAKGTSTRQTFDVSVSRWATRYAGHPLPRTPPSPSLPLPPPVGVQGVGLPSPLLSPPPSPPSLPARSQVSDRDIENMITVMSPSLNEHQHAKGARGGASSHSQPDAGGGAHGGVITEEAGTVAAKISFERYKMTMQSSFTRTFQRGQYVIAL